MVDIAEESQCHVPLIACRPANTVERWPRQGRYRVAHVIRRANGDEEPHRSVLAGEQTLAQKVQCGDHRELTDASAVTGESELGGIRAAVEGHADEHRANGLTVLLGWPGDAGHRQSYVGIQHASRTLGHSDGGLSRDDRPFGDVQQIELHVALVRHDRPSEEAARTFYV